MAISLFSKAILEGAPIKLFIMAGCGETSLISTTSAASCCISSITFPLSTGRCAPARIYNLGNQHPEELLHVVALLEGELGSHGDKGYVANAARGCHGNVR
jgi:UDP-glucuronate 4-epimerase